MNAIFALVIGGLVFIGVYQLLGKDLIRIAFGLYILFNGLNVLIMTMGTVPGGNAPFAQLGGPYVDPLVQAMVLTAIVIGFGLATFLLVLAARLAQKRQSLDAEEMTRWKH